MDLTMDPVTLSVPDEPVLASDGSVYDGDTLRHIVEVANKEGHPPRSPITREVLRAQVFPTDGGAPWRLYLSPATNLRVGVDWVKAGDKDASVAVFMANLMAECPGAARLALDISVAEGNHILGWDPDPVVQGWARRLGRALRLDAMFTGLERLCCAHPVFLGGAAGDCLSPLTLEEHFVACTSLWT